MKFLKILCAFFLLVNPFVLSSSLFSGENKVYGFGEVDPLIKEKKDVDVQQRLKNVSAYSLIVLGVALPMGPVGVGIAAPLTIAGSAAYLSFTNSLYHPDTGEMGLNAEDHGSIPLNTYVDAHDVIVTKDGPDSFKWKKELIKSAKHSIEFSGSFCGGDAFFEALLLMEDKLKENREIQFRLLITPDLLHPRDKDKLKELETTYPYNFHVLLTPHIPTSVPGLALPENHVKIIIMDECYFLMGGSNFQESMLSSGEGHEEVPEDRPLFEEMSGSHWRDMDMVGKGPIAKTLRLEYYKLWAKWAFLEKEEKILVNHYTPINSIDAYVEAFELSPKKVAGVTLKAVAGSPLWTENEIMKEYCRLIDEAIQEKKSITIANMIFYPAKNLLDKIKEAIEGGCKLTIISNNLQDNASAADHIFFNMNRDGFANVYRKARECGKEENIEIYEYHVPDGMYHKKVWCIGEDISIFSSANLGTKSNLYDDELAIVIKSKEVAEQLTEVLEKDKTLSIKMGAEEIMSISSQLKGTLGILLDELM